MRESVGTRGAAASTFDVVAREAGVSRGLLHYYFGSKERLLVEVVRRDCDARIAALEDALARGHAASTRWSTILVASLEDFVEDEPGTRRSSTRWSAPRATARSSGPRWPSSTAAGAATWPTCCGPSSEEGVVTLDADPEAVASMLFALGDGIGLQLFSDPAWDGSAALEVGARTARRLLGG